MKVKKSALVLPLIHEQTKRTDALLLHLTVHPYAPCYNRQRL